MAVDDDGDMTCIINNTSWHHPSHRRNIVLMIILSLCQWDTSDVVQVSSNAVPSISEPALYCTEQYIDP